MTLSVALEHRFEGFALDVRFDAPAGVTALFGRSGSGKTTVVNAVAGLLRPDRGRVSVNGSTLFDTTTGHWLPPHRRRVGYVFQEARLFPHFSVRGNLLFGAWFAGGGRDVRALDHVVEMLGLGGLLARRPAALSGGERQRVAIGRALLSRPRLLLMDEPLAALDDPRKAEILPYLERLRDDTAVPIVYVSHSVPEVARLATTVVALSAGRVIRSGPAVDVLADPEAVPDLGVRAAGAILTGRVVAHHHDGLSEIAVSAGSLFVPRVTAAIGARLRLRVAAQDVLISREAPRGLSALNVLPGRITGLRRGSGPGVVVQIRVGEDSILARVTQRSADALQLAPGVACHAIAKTLSVAPDDVGGALNEHPVQ